MKLFHVTEPLREETHWKAMEAFSYLTWEHLQSTNSDSVYMHHQAWAPFLVSTGMKGDSGLGVESNGGRGIHMESKGV